MISLKTLSKYLFKLYLGYFVATLFFFIGILTISNIFDILYKFKTIDISLHFFWKLTFYKIPYLLNEISPLISFISMLFFLRKLTRYNELIIILCSGIHIFRIIIIPALTVLILGIISIFTINPISTLGLQKYSYIETKLINIKTNDLITSQYGLLFFEHYNNNSRFVQTKSVNVTEKKLNNITILFVDSNNYFIKRIDAKQAILSDNYFTLTNVKVFTNNNAIMHNNLIIPTNLSIDDLTNSFITPEMLTIMNLAHLIKQLIKSGLSTINYQIYYYKQLFKPITMFSTVMLASCFINLKQRDNSQNKIFISGLFIGFTIYALLEVLLKILAYNDIKPILAVLLPNIIVLLISNFIILYSNDT